MGSGTEVTSPTLMDMAASAWISSLTLIDLGGCQGPRPSFDGLRTWTRASGSRVWAPRTQVGHRPKPECRDLGNRHEGPEPNINVHGHGHERLRPTPECQSSTCSINGYKPEHRRPGHWHRGHTPNLDRPNPKHELSNPGTVDLSPTSMVRTLVLEIQARVSRHQGIGRWYQNSGPDHEYWCSDINLYGLKLEASGPGLGLNEPW